MSMSLSRTMEDMCCGGATGVMPPYLQPQAASRLAAQVAATNLVHRENRLRHPHRTDIHLQVPAIHLNFGPQKTSMEVVVQQNLSAPGPEGATISSSSSSSSSSLSSSSSSYSSSSSSSSFYSFSTSLSSLSSPPSSLHNHYHHHHHQHHNVHFITISFHIPHAPTAANIIDRFVHEHPLLCHPPPQPVSSAFGMGLQHPTETSPGEWSLPKAPLQSAMSTTPHPPGLAHPPGVPIGILSPHPPAAPRNDRVGSVPAKSCSTCP